MNNTKKIYITLLSLILVVVVIGISVTLALTSIIYSANASLNFHIDPIPAKPNFILHLDAPSDANFNYRYCKPKTIESWTSPDGGEVSIFDAVDIIASAEYIGDYSIDGDYNSDVVTVNSTYFFNPNPLRPNIVRTDYMNDFEYYDFYFTTNTDSIDDNLRHYSSDALTEFMQSIVFTIVNPSDNYVAVYFNAIGTYDDIRTHWGDTDRNLQIESLGYAQQSGTFGTAETCNKYYTIFDFASSAVPPAEWVDAPSGDAYSECHSSYVMLKPNEEKLINDNNYVNSSHALVSGGLFSGEIDPNSSRYHNAYVYIEPKGAIKCKWTAKVCSPGDGYSQMDMEQCNIDLMIIDSKPNSATDLRAKIESTDVESKTTIKLYAGTTADYGTSTI